jgi:hypothetical protein
MISHVGRFTLFIAEAFFLVWALLDLLASHPVVSLLAAAICLHWALERPRVRY